MRLCATLAVAALLATSKFASPASGDELFSIVIDPFTGAAELRNDSPQTIDLDGYLLTSRGNPVLTPADGNWQSLADNGTPGWLESFSAGNRLGELNLFDALSIAPGQSVGIGNPYQPFSPSGFGEPEPGLGTLSLTYTRSGGTSQEIGDVEFSARNTVVLVVDPSNGNASLVNQSNFDIDLDSYLITSSAAALDVPGWEPLQNSLGLAGGWFSSTGAANRIAEGNLFGSSFLAANGGSLSLGSPIDHNLLNDESDLQLEITVAGSQSIAGGVLFASGLAPAPLLGDFNGDGFVNIADYTTWRDLLGSSDPLNGNGDENGASAGVVDGADYSLWKSNFGASLAAAQLAAGPLALSGTAVPEPSSLAGIVLLSVAIGAPRGFRRRR